MANFLKRGYTVYLCWQRNSRGVWWLTLCGIICVCSNALSRILQSHYFQTSGLDLPAIITSRPWADVSPIICPEILAAIQIFFTHMLSWHSGPLIFPLLVHAVLHHRNHFCHHGNERPQVISQCLALFAFPKILPPVFIWVIVSPVHAINYSGKKVICALLKRRAMQYQSPISWGHSGTNYFITLSLKLERSGLIEQLIYLSLIKVFLSK